MVCLHVFIKSTNATLTPTNHRITSAVLCAGVLDNVALTLGNGEDGIHQCATFHFPREACLVSDFL